MLGATIADVGFRQDFGKKAMFVGAVCACLPDLDLFSGAWGPWGSMAHHRAETHSVLVLTFIAPLVAYFCHKKWQEGTLWRWTALCWLALVTHPLLDAVTTYGTQLLAPLSRQRFAIDGVAVVDPFYSVILLAGVVYGYRVVDEKKLKTWVTKLTLALSTGYLILGLFFSAFAEAQIEREITKRGISGVTQVRATPTLLNILLWHVVVKEESGHYWLGQVSVLTPDKVFLKRYETAQSPLVKAAMNSREGKIFTWFAQDMVSARVNGRVVTLFDHRYGMPSSPLITPFRAAFTFDEAGKLVKAERLRGPRSKMDIVAEFKTLFRHIFYGPGEDM